MLVAPLAVLALVGVLVVLAALVALHALPTGLSPIRDAVSAYGISPYRWLYRTQTIATGVTAAALAIAVPSAIASGTVGAVIALWVLAVARAVIGWFPMDAPGATRTGTGRLHNVLAFGAFAAASVGGFMTGIAFGGDPRFVALAGISTALGWLMSAASLLTLLAARIKALSPIFGLAERLIYLGMLAWLATVAAALLTSGTPTA